MIARYSKFILILLLVGASQISAQIHKVNLVEQKGQFVELNGFNVHQVLDARTDKHSIGWVQKGLINKKVLADFSHGLEKELETLFQRPNSVKEKRVPVLMKFNAFEIWEETNFSSEVAYVFLEVEVYLVSDAGYRFVSDFQSHSQVNGMDVTSKHGENIIDALQKVLNELNSVEIELLAEQNYPLTLVAVRNAPKRISVYNHPVVQDKSLNKGIYQTFNEFKNNHPRIKEGYVVEKKPRKQKEWKGSFDVTLFDKATGKKFKKNIWGFSDGQTAYVYHKDQFYPLDITKTKISFEAMDKSVESMNAAAIAGGALGAGIAALASKVKRQTILINPNTGGITPASRYNNDLDKRIFKVVLYRPDKKEKDTIIEVLDANGNLLETFRPGSYLELEVEMAHTALVYKARIKENPREAVVKLLPKTNEIYIEVSNSVKSKTHEPVIRIVDKDVGKYYENRLNYLNKNQ